MLRQTKAPYEMNFFFSFLPWPPVKAESRLFQRGLRFRAIKKSLNTSGILSPFDVTVEKMLYNAL